MNKRSASAQLVIGPYELEVFTPAQIGDKIRNSIDAGRLERLLYWPSPSAAITEQVLAICDKSGVEPYLWWPTLADAINPGHAELLHPLEDERAVNAWGETAGRLGVWENLGKSEEKFIFACPEAEGYGDRVFDEWRKQFGAYAGVFIDRIRYPSAINGLESLFGCFCGRCLAAQPEALEWREGARRLLDWLRGAGDADFGGDTTLAVLFERFGLSGLFAHKSEAIFRVVDNYAELARARDKGVGLDLFTFSLGALYGQDFARLARAADWIKPMLYCHSLGPGGISLETSCLARGIRQVNPRLSEKAVLAMIGRGIGCQLPDSVAELEANGVPETYAGMEWRRASLAAGADCPVYPGFEMINHPLFRRKTLRIHGDVVERYLEAVAGAPGIVACFNLLYIPEEHFRAMAKALEN